MLFCHAQCPLNVAHRLSLPEGAVSGADVILTGANITLLHYAYADVEPNVLNEVSVPLEERFFRLPSGERTAN